MAQRDRVKTPSPNRDLHLFLGLLVSLLLPATITLLSVRHPGVLAVELRHATPYGYTLSLLLFLVPTAWLAFWHLARQDNPVAKRAFVTTIFFVTLLGTVLDVFFGAAFFTFPNPHATLGVRLPAWSFERGWVPDYLPIEEFGFYVLGGWFMVSLYVWCDAHWFRAYRADRELEARRQPTPLVVPLWSSLLIAAALVGLAWWYKKAGDHPYHQGFPGYFSFLVCLAVLPTLALFRAVKRFVNWRALAFTFFVLLLVSLLWEATLGVPYGWWRYQYSQMMGLTIGAWAHLPIEAVLLWCVAAWGAVICYEHFLLTHLWRLPYRQALFGARGRRGDEPPPDRG